jgi:hypothetical protein
MDLDTFLTQLYVIVDDWYKAEMARDMARRTGPSAKLSDSEVLTIGLAGQWRVGVPWRSERGVVRYMQKHGRGWFPNMLQRSQFNERVRALWAVFVRLQQAVAGWLYRDELFEVVDCTELPHCSLSQAASHDRHWLSGGLGRGGNNGGWFYGEQVLMSTSSAGVITGWLVGQAQIDDRWMMEAFLSTRHSHMRMIGPEPAKSKKYNITHVATPESFGPALTTGVAVGLPYLADEGFNGDRWRVHWLQEYTADVITAPPKNAATAWTSADKKWLSKHRQIVETVFARLTTVFSLKRLNAHSDWGKITRLAAITAAYNLGILLNRILRREDGALETLIT